MLFFSQLRLTVVGVICVWTASVSVADAVVGAPADNGWGTLKGKIIITETVPESLPEKVGQHPDVALCLVDGQIPVDDNLVVSNQGELRDVFVMMVAKGKGENAPIHPSYDRGKSGAQDDAPKLSIDNVACRFVPHALFVRAGNCVKLKNSDSVGHNCHITTFTNEHNVTLQAGGEVNIKLEKSHKAVGQVKCDIHKWMDALILVRDNPYVAITDEDGSFEIKYVPAGDWEFQFWHKKGSYLKSLKVEGHKTSRKGIIDVVIEPDQELDLGTMQVPGDSLTK